MNVMTACVVLLVSSSCTLSVQESTSVKKEVEEAVQKIRSGEFCADDAAAQVVFSLGDDAYPILRDLLSVGAESGQPCGHSLTHAASLPIVLEDDVELTTLADGKEQALGEGFSVAQYAAYLTIAVHVGDLYFAETCEMKTESDQEQIVEEFRELLTSSLPDEIGCGLREILSRHSVTFEGCPLEDDLIISVDDLGLHCDDHSDAG